MSSSSENIESTQNDRSVRISRNAPRPALNNVTNTIVSQQNTAQQSSIRNLKNALAKRESSRIPQYNRDSFVRSILSSGKNLANKSEKLNEVSSSSSDSSKLSSSLGSENKENQAPLPYVANARSLPSIEEETRDKNHEKSLLPESQSSLSSSESEIEGPPSRISARTFDAGKKRPISTVVEQDVPKKFKVCGEDGQEEYEWEDLDAEDSNDPFMVSEYVNDIFDYLSHLEVVTLPREEDLYKHRNIRQNRDILVNWLVKIHNKFGLLPETLYLAINTMDRFLCKELVQLDKLQLVGTSCLFIASKYEEVYSPSIKHFASETDGACTEEEIKEGEKFILKTLGFNLNYPNPMNFLRRISKADDYDIQSRTLAKFLLEISLVDFRFVGILPSLCAAAAMFLSRKMLGKGKWDGNLTHYSGGYTKAQLAPVCHMIMDYLVSPIVHDEFHRKYQSRRFMKASIISVQWALKVRKNGYDIMTLHE
ncbi:hypothetical protein HG537_0H02470 [Torulaspora globosa]|uniref:Cyclin N-terminal domain-containing protein n=1 Tax=Torulaspora globosa TaxID=48254 RepID=A0A7H9I0S8_9SACH|nr:hypothetical protein HG537_0H02470 [Torulaspora sp. CBS 2947]